MTDRQYAIGIDLGGTSIKFGLLDSDGQFLHEGKVPSYADISAEDIINQLVRVAEETKSFAHKHNYPITGIGIGSPGIIDTTGRTVLGGAENLKGWENLALAEIIETRTALPVILDNDANLMGLGELTYGAGKGCTDIIFLTIGTGIGGAIVIDGKLFGGFANRGTELGHTPLIATGERCACGATGCLEHYASTAALVRRFTALANEQGLNFNTEINGELIVRLYHESFPLAVECMNEHFYYLGRGIAGFINIFSPQRIIIGGGLSEAGDFYFEEISKVAFKHAFSTCAENTQIMRANLGNRAGTAGAASLVFQSKIFHKDKS
ncbi:ROK family protein [Bacteroides oleiciplenus]|uniref:ROK family protein n=1 Tax=Bacteroides oleiciplenus TaxID=626931 RepID=A0A3E5BRN0_9BACE|nr:ROK family protein [Bacteroides oleiciplenus]RGN40278.1 ROK family protein [Bacteroides oleiciplenus]